MSGLDPVLKALGEGRMIVITGDRLRGGDIDFCVAASRVTPEAINFMATHGRGLVCLALTPARAVRLGIELINPGRENQSGRPHGRSIEAATGVSTGISAADRAHTIAVAVAEGATASDIVSPGHVFPLITSEGGVRERPAAAEAAIQQQDDRARPGLPETPRQFVHAESRARKVGDAGIVQDQSMILRAVSGEAEDHDVVLLRASQGRVEGASQRRQCRGTVGD